MNLETLQRSGDVLAFQGVREEASRDDMDISVMGE